jgi:hypothetical protein
MPSDDKSSWADKLSKAEPVKVDGLPPAICQHCGDTIKGPYSMWQGKTYHTQCVEHGPYDGKGLRAPPYYARLSEDAYKALRPQDVSPVGYVTGASKGRVRVAVMEGLYDFLQSDVTPITREEAEALTKAHPVASLGETVFKVKPFILVDTTVLGRKDDQGKARWDLLPFGPVQRVVDVLTYGATKYSPDNWQHVANPRSRYLSAALRHISSYHGGEAIDPESGHHHLAHAVCCLLFLLWFEK